jgi:hypothetical protein
LWDVNTFARVYNPYVTPELTTAIINQSRQSRPGTSGGACPYGFPYPEYCGTGGAVPCCEEEEAPAAVEVDGLFSRLRTSVISSWVRPFDSRKASRFARAEVWTLGSERKVRAEETRSSRMAILQAALTVVVVSVLGGGALMGGRTEARIGSVREDITC